MSSSPDPFAAFPSWLAAARQGDAAGFAGLYDWLGGEVKRFVIGRGARDADAVTNDAFVAAFRRLGDFDGDAAAFRSWVYTIARNTLIDAHRVESRRPPVATDPDVGLDPTPGASAEEVALSGLGTDAAIVLLAELTDAQQEVILLRVVNGLSLAETADAVRRPVSAVKRLQARGLSTLRRKIAGEGVSS